MDNLPVNNYKCDGCMAVGFQPTLHGCTFCDAEEQRSKAGLWDHIWDGRNVYSVDILGAPMGQRVVLDKAPIMDQHVEHMTTCVNAFHGMNPKAFPRLLQAALNASVTEDQTSPYIAELKAALKEIATPHV